MLVNIKGDLEKRIKKTATKRNMSPEDLIISIIDKYCADKTKEQEDEVAGIKGELIKFLHSQPKIKNPRAYVDWLESKYGDDNFKKLLKINFNDWITNLDYWKNN